MKHRGSCLCGKVTFEVNGDIKAVTHCHCRDCQKAHAAAFATFGSAKRQNFALFGEEHLSRFCSPDGRERWFCRNCGSLVRWLGVDEKSTDWITFPLALLDTEFQPVKQKHIWTVDQASWLEPCEAHPRFQHSYNKG